MTSSKDPKKTRAFSSAFALLSIFSLTALVLGVPSARAVPLNGNLAELVWTASTGPVTGYAVFVERNGVAPSEAEQTVPSNVVSVAGSFGDVLVVRVAGLDANGNLGPMSEASETIELVASPPPPIEPPPPDDPPPPEDPAPNEDPPQEPPEDDSPPASHAYFEDFESYGDGEDPDDWYDSAPRNSLAEDPALFETFVLTDGNVALGTRAEERNIHSHLLVPGSADWSAYEVSGLMSVDHHRAGIGVTLYSDFPDSKRYYRLKSRNLGSFRFDPKPHGSVSCVGTQDTGVEPRENQWYRFRFQARPEGDGTRLLAKVWEETTAEPADWQASCLDANGTLQAGRPGVWSRGSGLRLWDDLSVVPVLDPDTAEPPPGTPDAPYPGDAAGALYSESFESHGDAADPEGWFDTGARNSLREAPEIFETFALTDGSVAFGTASGDGNIHSHLTVAGSSGWSAYEFSGAMSKAEPKGGIGVTLYSDYPRSDSYYRLRFSTSTAGGFHLAAHPDGTVTCLGSTVSGVEPRAGAWYRFRFRAQPEGDGTRLQAQVWEEGASEPSVWQIDCLDPAGTLWSGTPGVWSKGPGMKLWDDLEIRPLEN